MEILNTPTDIRVFPRTFDYFSTVWDVGCFYQDHASRRNAKLQKYINILKGKTEKCRKKTNVSNNHLSTVYLKSSEKIICAISEIQ